MSWQRWGITAVVLVLVLVRPGFCATIRGRVGTADGKPVSGVKIAVAPFQASGSSHLAAAETNQSVEVAANGSYTIMNLPPATYVMKLVPGGTGLQAGEGVAALGQDGLTVNWVVSKTAAALAFATRGAALAQGAAP